MTGKALAAAAGAVAGYVVHQRRNDPTSDFRTDPKDLVASAPLANVAAAALAAVVTRSALAGFLVGFAVSALGGDQLNQMVARKVQEQRSTEPQFTQAA